MATPVPAVRRERPAKSRGALALADAGVCAPAVLLLASAMAVIVSGASPVFLIVIGTTFAAAAVPAATDGNVRRQAEHGAGTMAGRGP